MAYQLIPRTGQWVLVNTISEDFVLNPFTEGGQVNIFLFSGGDLTSDCTLITLGLKHGANEMLVEAFVPTQAGEVRRTTESLILPGEVRPFIRVTGGSAGDKIVLATLAYRLE